MTLPQTYIGVDIAKNWIDFHCLEDGRSGRIPTGELSEFATTCADAHVILEASGGYERPLTQALITAGIAYTRVNPRHARDFARATGRLAKTDRLDARILAEMGAALKPQPTQPPALERQELAELITRRDQLVKARKAELVRLQKTTNKLIRQDIKSLIAVLAARITKIEKMISLHIDQHESLKRLEKQMQSVPGIGPVVSATLMAFLPELGQLNTKAIASLAGLAPHSCDSGQMRGKRMIWGGRANVRRGLYLAAFSTLRHNNNGFAAYCQKLRDAGKPFKVAVIATARKLLITLNAIIKRNGFYNEREPA